MAEPQWACSSGLGEGTSGSLGESLTVQSDHYQPSLPKTPVPDSPPLLEGLGQEASLTHKQRERIHQLEQALDQSLAYVEELRHQLDGQKLLETQLAATEEIANIQQQAIIRLQAQLCQYQADTQERHHTFQAVLAAAETVTQSQQAELEQLRAQFVRDRVRVQGHQGRLERQLLTLQKVLQTQQQYTLNLEMQALFNRTTILDLEVQLEEARGQMQQLQAQLVDRHQTLIHLETQLRQTHVALGEQEALIQSLQQAVDPAFLPGVEAALAQVASLGSQAASQGKTHPVILQQALQNLQAEQKASRARIGVLEQQQAEMQEQILHQAQQASEYETAIQHWKDRCLTLQEQTTLLHQRLNELFPELPPDVVALLTQLQEPLPTRVAIRSIAPPFNRPLTIDLPEFLTKRRSYRQASPDEGSPA